MKAFQILGKKISDQPRELDQRSQNRILTRYYAYLHAARGNFLSDCLVKDMSETGARIILPRTASLPKRIMLRVAGEATPMNAFVVWQAGTKCGLEFIETDCVKIAGRRQPHAEGIAARAFDNVRSLLASIIKTAI